MNDVQGLPDGASSLPADGFVPLRVTSWSGLRSLQLNPMTVSPEMTTGASQSDQSE